MANSDYTLTVQLRCDLPSIVHTYPTMKRAIAQAELAQNNRAYAAARIERDDPRHATRVVWEHTA